jgi:hypothetical protein
MSLWFVWCKLCNYHELTLTSSPNRLKQDLTWPKSTSSSIGMSKKISEPMVRLGQTVRLSCVKVSAISKRTKTRFDMTQVTYKCHRVQPKQDLTWPKSPTSYRAPTLTPSRNGPKWDLTWPKSPRSSIGCVQKDFWAYGTFGANRHLSRIKISSSSKHTEMSFQLSLVT